MGGTTSDDDHIVVHHKDRGRAIVDKLIGGGASAPISEWTEAKLEKTIRRNSILREYADELRLARVNALLAAAQENSPIASTLGQADLLVLAAEELETRP